MGNESAHQWEGARFGLGISAAAVALAMTLVVAAFVLALTLSNPTADTVQLVLWSWLGAAGLAAFLQLSAQYYCNSAPDRAARGYALISASLLFLAAVVCIGLVRQAFFPPEEKTPRSSVRVAVDGSNRSNGFRVLQLEAAPPIDPFAAQRQASERSKFLTSMTIAAVALTILAFLSWVRFHVLAAGVFDQSLQTAFRSYFLLSATLILLVVVGNWFWESLQVGNPLLYNAALLLLLGGWYLVLNRRLARAMAG